MAARCFLLELPRRPSAQPRVRRRTRGNRQTRAGIEGHPREDRRWMDENGLQHTKSFGCSCSRERSITTFVLGLCRGRISTGHSFARPAGKDRLGGIRSRQERLAGHATVSTVEAAILTLLVFAVAGMLPAVAIAGLSGATPALAILVGAVESAVAGACVLAIAGTILPWYLLLSVLGALLSLPALVRRHRQRPPADRSAHRRSPIPTVATVTALVLTLAACLVPLRVPSVGWDARAIWLLRSSWFLQGHSYVLSAMRNQNPERADHPCLVPSLGEHGRCGLVATHR